MENWGEVSFYSYIEWNPRKKENIWLFQKIYYPKCKWWIKSGFIVNNVIVFRIFGFLLVKFGFPFSVEV